MLQNAVKERLEVFIELSQSMIHIHTTYSSTSATFGQKLYITAIEHISSDSQEEPNVHVFIFFP